VRQRKGRAFTGALERRAGYFELAAEGTIFLDEITEMSQGTTLEEGERELNYPANARDSRHYPEDLHNKARRCEAAERAGS